MIKKLICKLFKKEKEYKEEIIINDIDESQVPQDILDLVNNLKNKEVQ